VNSPLAVHANGSPLSVHTRGGTDPLIAALARYIEALHRRYPAGPGQMRRDGLDGRANMAGMHPSKKDTAA
jgi:hypothetical protein